MAKEPSLERACGREAGHGAAATLSIYHSGRQSYLLPPCYRCSGAVTLPPTLIQLH